MTHCKYCQQEIGGDNDCDCDETEIVRCCDCKKELSKNKAIQSAVFEDMYFCKDCARGDR
jgi:hypothetical protein